jgi:hypothetical protein
MGEEYVSSGDEASKKPLVNLDEVPEGDPTDPSSMAFKFNEYQKQLKKFNQENI